jgi:hypothetical protein
VPQLLRILARVIAAKLRKIALNEDNFI